MEKQFFNLNWIFRGLQFVIATIAVGLLVYFSMSGRFNHNDFMYVTTAMLSGHPYEDFNFVQSPLTYFFWNFVVNLLPDHNVFTGLRFISALLVSLAILVPAVFFFADKLNRAVFVLLSLSSEYVLQGAAEIANYSLTFAFLSIGFTSLFFKTKILIGFGALCLGAAAAAKISFILFLAPGLAKVLFLHNGLRNRDLIIFFTGGALIGLAPLLFFAVENFDNFLLHNLTFHSELTNEMRGLTFTGSLISILKGMVLWCLRESVLILIFAFLATKAIQKRTIILSSQLEKNLVITLLFLAVSFVVAWSPMILFSQYLMPASFFLVYLITITFGLMNGADRHYIKWPVLTIAVVAFLLPLGKNLNNAYKNNAIINHQIISRQLDMALERSSCEPIITTLSGSFLADTRGIPGPGSYTGIFWVRVFESTSQEIRGQVNLSLKETTFFPETAITDGNSNFAVTGFYNNRFEKIIDSTADSFDFEKIPLGEFQGKEMYLRKSPNC